MSKNQELQKSNEILSQENQKLSIEQVVLKKTIDDLENDLKRQSSETTMRQSETDQSDSSLGSGKEVKRLQQEVRVSKKAEQLAKEKFALVKKQLDKTEKDFNKYKEDSEARIESLKNEISILQKHYDQLQTSVNESELERSQNNSMTDKSSELIKMIEDYSRQNESKSKEIEFLNQRLDKKTTKIEELKKFKSQSETKISNLKGSLDEVKKFMTFFLNKSFIKGMKSQCGQLKEQIGTYEKDISKELEILRVNLTKQLNLMMASKEKIYKQALETEREKVIKVTENLKDQKENFDKICETLKKENSLQASTLEKQYEQKIQKLKQKVNQLSQRHQSEGDLKIILKEELTTQIQEKDKQIELLTLQLKGEKEKFEIKIADMERDLSNKNLLIQEYRNKEQSLQLRIDEIDQKYRMDVQKLVEKFDNDKMLWIQREVEKVDAREADRVKELKELYEKKVGDKDLEIARLRDSIHKMTEESSRQQSEMFKRSEENNSLKSQLEKEKLLYQQSNQELQSQANKNEEKISKLKTKIDNLSLVSNKHHTLSKLLEEQNKDLKSQVQTLTQKIEQLSEQLQEANDKLKTEERTKEHLENTLDQVRFDLHDEMKEKEALIEQLQRQAQALNHQMSVQRESIMKQYEEQISQLEEQITFFRVKQQLSDLQSSVGSRENNVDIQQKQTTKKIVKKRKKVENGTQTEAIESCLVGEEGRASIGIQTSTPASPRENSSEHIRGTLIGKSRLLLFTFQEEDSFAALAVTEQVEKRIVPVEHTPDMAMRGGTFNNPPGRFPAPRPQLGRGRALPSFQPRPPFGSSQQIRHQQPQYTLSQQFEESKAQSQEQDLKHEIISQETNQMEEFKSEIVQSREIIQQPLKQVEKQNEMQDHNEPKMIAKEEEEEQQPKHEEKKVAFKEEEKEPSKQIQPQTDQSGSMVLGLLNTVLSYLKRRKQAHVGRPASQMYWDEKRKRYIIDPDDLQEEDVPPPPPPMTKKTETTSQDKSQEEEKKEQPSMVSNPTDLTKPAMPTYLANRGRGRGSRQAPAQRSPALPAENTEAKEEVKELQQESKQEEVSELYITTLDINPPTHDQTVIMNKSEMQAADAVRESQWMEKFHSQQERINTLKYKVSMLQQELSMQRDENEQTIENFTTLCQDLKFKGLEEAEDLQTEIQILRDQLKTITTEKAIYEIKNSQLLESFTFFESENKALYAQLTDARCALLQHQIESEMQRDQPSSEEITALEKVNDDLAKALMDLKVELDKVKWQKAILEAEKLEKQLFLNDYMESASRQGEKVAALQSENKKLQEDIKALSLESQQFSQDQMIKIEREKESLKEMVARVQTEKERLLEQNRERVGDYELRLKKAESEKLRMEQEAQTQAREKDVTIEGLRNQVSILGQNAQQKDQEISQLGAQITVLQQKISSLVQKRQSESEQAEGLMKHQLRQIQEILQQKTNQLEQYESKQEEINQELQSMNLIRHKLTENIVYLQNEIRKRDELLETSEFGDFDIIDDEDSVLAAEDESLRGQDLPTEEEGGNAAHSQRHSQFVNIRRKRRTWGQQLQSQLDETRAQLKHHIEEKMRVQQQVQAVQRNMVKLSEGILDINNVLEQQHQSLGLLNQNTEQSSSLFEEPKDSNTDDSLILQTEETLAHIIAKIFSLQRHYESELSEQKHRLKLGQMQLEESENLKFDIEMLTDEKAILERDLSHTKDQLREVEARAAQLKERVGHLEQSEQQLRMRLSQAQQEFDAKVAKERAEMSQQLQVCRIEAKKQLEEIKESFKVQVLPQVKQKYKEKYSQLQEQLKTLREDMQNQLIEAKQMNVTLEEQNNSLMNQSMLNLANENEERQRMREEITDLQFQRQKLQNELITVQVKAEKLNDQVKELKAELHDQEIQFSAYKDQTEKDFREAALALKAKIDEKRKQIKEMQEKFREQVQKIVEQHQTQLKQQADQMNSNFNDEKQILVDQISILQSKQEHLPSESDKELKQVKQELANLKEIDRDFKAPCEAAITQIQEETKEQHESIIQDLRQQLIALQSEKDQEIDNLKNISRQIKAQMTEQNQKLISELDLLRQGLSMVECQAPSSEIEQELMTKLKESENQILVARQECEKRIQEKEAEFQTEKNDMLAHYNQREEEIKSMALQATERLKAKIKKEKEKTKSAMIKADQVVKEKESLQNEMLKQGQTSHTEVMELKQIIENIQSENSELKLSIKNLMEDLDKSQEERRLLQIELGEIIEDVIQLLKCLEVDIGQEPIHQWKVLLEKLKEHLQNYEEDKRCLQSLMHEKDELIAQRDAYYQERESIAHEKSQIMEKYEAMDVSKLEKKVKMLEEERSVMRSDYVIQMESFAGEIDRLKQRLAGYESSLIEESKSQPHETSLADLTNPGMAKAQPSFMDESKTSDIQSRKEGEGGQTQRSGFGSYIASFFLTESELDNQQQ